MLRRIAYSLMLILFFIGYSTFAENKNNFYSVSAHISSDMRDLRGEAKISYFNSGEKPITSLYILADCNELGELIIEHVEDSSGAELPLEDLKKVNISPPLHNRKIQVLSLNNSVSTGKSITFSVQFTVKNMKKKEGMLMLLDDTIFSGSCWYPRIITLEGERWRYSVPDAPGYEVSMIFPKELMLIASSEGTYIDKAQDKKSVSFRAEKLRGLSIIAAEAIQTVSGEIEEYSIKSYFSEKERAWGIRMASLAHEAVEFYLKKYDFFPYKQISLVAALPIEPRSITLDGIIILPSSFTDMVQKWGFNFSLNFTQWLIAHSLAKQYWGILVAEAPLYPPWITSAFNLYSDREYLHSLNLNSSIYYNYIDYYLEAAQRGKDTNLSQPLGLLETEGYDWQNILAKGKGLAILNMLQYLIGKDKIDSIAAKMLQNYSYSLIDYEEFIQLCQSVSDVPLDSFFQQWLYSSTIIDYAIGDIKSSDSKGKTISKIEILRQGEAQMPVPIRITLSNGEQISRRSNGIEKKEEIVITADNPVFRVELDPEQLLPDVNYANNYKVLTSMVNREPLFPIDDYFEIGELSFIKKFSSQGIFYKDNFQLMVRNRQDAVQGLGIIILVQKSGWRRMGKRSLFITLNPNETKIINDYYLLPDKKGKMKVMVSFYRVDSLQEFRSQQLKGTPDLKTSYIIYLK
jgi:hypothetical protein